MLTRLSTILNGLLEAIDKAIDGATGEDDPVVGIFKCRQYRRKTERIKTGFQVVATDNSFEATCKELVNKCINYERKLFNYWIINADDILVRKLKSLEKSSKFIEVNESNILRVVFDDEIVRVIHQERKLKNLEFDTESIQAKIVIAKKHYKLAASLTKALSIRNKIELCASCEERDLLQRRIFEFDDLVRRHCGYDSHHDQAMNRENIDNVFWINRTKCEKLVSMLNNIASKLSIEAKAINLHHQKNSKHITELFKCDLLLQKSDWLRLCLGIEDGTIEQTSQKEGKWVCYWAHQVFKVFEGAYIKGLMRLNEVIREIRCEMVMNGNQIDIHPSLSEIRSELYAQFRSFVEYPIMHNSLFSNVVAFNLIPRIHEKNAAVAFGLCERAVVILKAKIGYYTKKLIPAFDISSYAMACCHEAKDFVTSFQWLKSQKNLIDKWPEVETINGCIKVSLRRVKYLMEDRILYHKDSLVDSLQRNVLDDYQLVQDYISSAYMLFTKGVPTDIADIALVESNWKTANSLHSSIEKIAKSAHDKFQLLSKLHHETSTSKNMNSFLSRMDCMKLTQVRSVYHIH